MNKSELETQAEKICVYTDQIHRDCFVNGYVTGALKREQKIADLERENRLLGERCNQLLKDKGNLTDELAKWKDEWQEQVQKAIDEGRERTKLTGRVRELEKENAELKKRKEELIALINAERERQEKCDDVHLRTIAELEKENGNLKALRKYEVNVAQSEIGKLEKENAELKQQLEDIDNATDCFNKQEEIIAKAKELLKQWVELYKPKLEGYPISPIQEHTEQFIKEIEK